MMTSSMIASALTLFFFAVVGASASRFEKFPAGAAASCPKGFEITTIRDCKVAGSEFNGLVNNGEVSNGNWNTAPCGCFIKHGSTYYDEGEESCGNATTTALLCKKFIVKDNDELIKAVDDHLSSTGSGYPIDLWDVSNVEDFGNCFATTRKTSLKDKMEAFNEDISKWDTSNAKSMKNMFHGAKSFNSDLSKWDISKVEYTATMFDEASSFNSDVSKWDTSKVKRMDNMFAGAKAFNQDVSKWDVSNVENMSSMFANAELFNADISKWDISKVKNMKMMFKDAASFDKDLCRWGSNIKELDSSAIEEMFLGTKCPATEAIDLSSALHGPFCHECTISVTAVQSTPLAQEAVAEESKPEQNAAKPQVTADAGITSSKHIEKAEKSKSEPKVIEAANPAVGTKSDAEEIKPKPVTKTEVTVAKSTTSTAKAEEGINISKPSPLPAVSKKSSVSPPTNQLTTKTTAKPIVTSTAAPTDEPTAEPTDEPTAEPTRAPTAKPTNAPTAKKTGAPTEKPTRSPTLSLTAKPKVSTVSASKTNTKKDESKSTSASTTSNSLEKEQNISKSTAKKESKSIDKKSLEDTPVSEEVDKEEKLQTWEKEVEDGLSNGIEKMGEWGKELESDISNDLAQLQFTAGFLRGVIYVLVIFLSFTVCIACYFHRQTDHIYQLLATHEAELKSLNNSNRKNIDTVMFEDEPSEDTDYPDVI